MDRARRGEGPTLIESRTYRHKGHTVLDQKNYRTKEEIAEWVARDPIERFLKTVNEAERLDEDEVQAIDAQIEREVEHAVAFAEASPWPSVDVIERDVYAGVVIMAVTTPQPSAAQTATREIFMKRGSARGHR